MNDVLTRLRDVIQEDIGHRGLRTDPNSNLINAFPDDFAAACRSIAETAAPVIGIVTGFFIPTASPPAGETDGPLGALFLARALRPLGMKVVLYTDPFCERALIAGVKAVTDVPVCTVPSALPSQELTHLIALERVGPSHTIDSLRAQGASETTIAQFTREVPIQEHDRCHTMRGRDITDMMAPAHRLFEASGGRESPGAVSQVQDWILHRGTDVPRSPVTIGIGDGGNEIGMGKLPWDTIRRNIPGGGLVACRVPTDHLIVAGISNWGAYGLAAGVRQLRGQGIDANLFDVERERELLRVMVEAGPLVDGVAGRPTVTVDGIDFDRYAEPLRAIGRIVAEGFA